MMSSENIIEVNEASFQNEVVVYSSTIPGFLVLIN